MYMFNILSSVCIEFPNQIDFIIPESMLTID